MHSASEFSPHVGAAYRFGTTELRLIQVEAGRPSSAGPEAFTLIFAGPSSPVLPEGSYETRGPAGLVGTLHVMPIHTAGSDRQDYQVVFN